MASNIWISIDEFSEFFTLNTEELYNELFNFCKWHKSYANVLEYFGGYEILLTAKSIIGEKILKKELIRKTDVFKLFKGVSYNIIRNKSRLKCISNYSNLRQYRSIEEINENQIIEFPLYYEDTRNDYDKYIDNLFRLVGKMYTFLNAGDFAKCTYYAKYLSRIIQDEENLVFRQLATGFLSNFKANLFFDQGKLGMSSKYINESINIFKEYADIIGPSFLGAAYNTKAMIEINMGNTVQGMNIFESNLNFLIDIENQRKEYSISEVRKKCELYAFMFKGNTNYSKLDYLIQKILKDDEVSKSSFIANLYAKAYLLIDNGLSNKAIYLLEGVDKSLNLLDNNEEFELNKMRYYSAFAEALLFDFKNRNKSDLNLALSFLEISKSINEIINNRYFKSINQMFEGYILNDKTSALGGLNMLKYYQFQHYYDWYKKKLVAFI